MVLINDVGKAVNRILHEFETHYRKRNKVYRSSPMFVLQRNKDSWVNCNLEKVYVTIQLINRRGQLFKEEHIFFDKILEAQTKSIDQQISKLAAELVTKSYDVDVRPVVESGPGAGYNWVFNGYFVMHSNRSFKRGGLSAILSPFYRGDDSLPSLKRICEETEDGNRISWTDASQRFPIEQFYSDIKNYPNPYLSKIVFFNADNNGELFENLNIKVEKIERESKPDSYLYVVRYDNLSMEYFTHRKFKHDVNIIREFKLLLRK